MIRTRRALQLACGMAWALLALVGGLVLFVPPQLAVPLGALKSGSHNIEVNGGPVGSLYRHHLRLAVDSAQFADLDVLVNSRIGHARVESTEAILLPVYFRDRVLLHIKGPESATAKLTQVRIKRQLLPGGWLLLVLLGTAAGFFHWLAKEPLTKEKLLKAGLLLGSSAAGLLLCAGALQIFGSRWMPQQEWRVFPPHLDETISILPDITPGIPEGIARFKTNSEGIRARERGRDFADSFSVLCIGASTTECILLGDNHWPRLLEARLQTVKGTNVWVGNAGHSGFSTAKLVLVASNYVPRIKPKVVVVLTGFNEGIVPETVSEPDLTETATGFLGTLKMNALKIRAVWLMKQMLLNYRSRSPNDFDMSNDTSGYETLRAKFQEQARRTPPRDRNWEDLDLTQFARELRRLHDICRRYSARLILCTQPTMYRADLKPEEERLLWMMGNYTPASKRRRMDKINERLRQTAKEMGVQVVDLDHALPRTTEVFYDDCHFNVSGARLVADLVFEKALITSPR